MKKILNNENKNIKSNIVFYNEDCDCKSDPRYFHFEKQNNVSENENSVDIKEDIVFKRVSTIIDEFYLKDKEQNIEVNEKRTRKNNWKTKLGFIHSNFFNNFNI